MLHRSLRRLIILALLILGLTILVHAALLYLQSLQPYQLIGNRQEFADNACAKYTPTGADRHTTVFVDPGHGGPDPGTSGTAPDGAMLQEKTLTLAVAMDMLPLLRRDGYTVVLSRIGDAPVARLGPGSLSGRFFTPGGLHADLQARIDCANAAGAKLLLSIHFNAYGDPGVGGIETIYDPDRPFSPQNLHFAQLVQQAVLSSFFARGWTIPDRSVIPDTEAGTPALTTEGASYGHLFELGPPQAGWLDHPSQMPGALCEPLFLTDPGEAAVIESRLGQQTLAGAFTSAINQYFGAG